jgi:hypothetical protein
MNLMMTRMMTSAGLRFNGDSLAVSLTDSGASAAAAAAAGLQRSSSH